MFQKYCLCIENIPWMPAALLFTIIINWANPISIVGMPGMIVDFSMILN